MIQKNNLSKQSKNKFILKKLFIYKFLQKKYGLILKKTEKAPFTILFLLFFIFVAIIALSAFIKQPKKDVQQSKIEIKKVKKYSLESAFAQEYKGQVEKKGIYQISSLSQGIVYKIYVKEGQSVKAGKTIAHISSNYQGSTISSAQRAIAQRQYQHTLDTFDQQNNLIQKQKETASNVRENADELSKITRDSLSSSQSIINLNDSILSTIENNLKDLEDTNTNGSNDSLILSTKQLKSQYLSVNNNLKNALNSTDYTTKEDNPTDKLSGLQKEITIGNLELQKKALQLNKDIGRLQLRVAQIGESLAYPSSPINGVVDKVYVKEGQLISPSIPIAQITNPSLSEASVIVYVPSSMIQHVSQKKPSNLIINNNKIELKPSYISSQPVLGELNAIYFTLPEKYADSVIDKEYISVLLSFDETSKNGIIHVPLEVVFHTSSGAYVYIAQKNIATSKNVELGLVEGNYVEVIKGLSPEDIVILDRSVLSGDRISF